jgi:hypothetical protein
MTETAQVNLRIWHIPYFVALARKAFTGRRDIRARVGSSGLLKEYFFEN